MDYTFYPRYNNLDIRYNILRSNQPKVTNLIEYVIYLYKTARNIPEFILNSYSIIPVTHYMDVLYPIAIDTCIRALINNPQATPINSLISSFLSHLIRILKTRAKIPTALPVIIRAIELLAKINPKILTKNSARITKIDNLLRMPGVQHHPKYNPDYISTEVFHIPQNDYIPSVLTVTSYRLTFDKAVERFGLIESFKRHDIPETYADELLKVPLRAQSTINYFPSWISEEHLFIRLKRCSPEIAAAIYLHPNATPNIRNTILKRKNPRLARILAISGHMHVPLWWCLSHPTLAEPYKVATTIYRTMSTDLRDYANMVLEKAKNPVEYFAEIEDGYPTKLMS